MVLTWIKLSQLQIAILSPIEAHWLVCREDPSPKRFNRIDFRGYIPSQARNKFKHLSNKPKTIISQAFHQTLWASILYFSLWGMLGFSIWLLRWLHELVICSKNTLLESIRRYTLASLISTVRSTKGIRSRIAREAASMWGSYQEEDPLLMAAPTRLANVAAAIWRDFKSLPLFSICLFSLFFFF